MSNKKTLGGPSPTAVATAGSSDTQSATARHTAGQWFVKSDFVGPFRVVDEKDSTLAVVGYRSSSEAMANAELIAAAPEMYEALLSIRTWAAYVNSSMGLAARVLERAEAAIAKAEGRS